MILFTLMKAFVLLVALLVLSIGVHVGLRFISWRFFIRLYPDVTFEEYCSMLDGTEGGES